MRNLKRKFRELCLLQQVFKLASHIKIWLARETLMVKSNFDLVN